MRSKHHIHVSYFDILRRRDRRKVGKKWRNVRRSFEVVTEKSPFSSQTQIITVSSIKLKIYHYVWSSFASRLDFTISLYPSFEYYTLTLRRIFPREESRLEKISRKGREREREKKKGSFILRNFLFRNVSLVDKTGGGEKKKERTRLDTETRSENQGETGQERGLFPADLPIPPSHLSSMEERATRSYRFPINRSVEQILPRVLFRTLFRRVYSVPRSSIKCRVSRARPSLPRVPSRSISSRAYETELFPLCPDLLPSPFLRISNISKLIGGEKMGEWTSNLEKPQREWRSFTRRRDLVIKFRYDRNPGWNFVSYLA